MKKSFLFISLCFSSLFFAQMDVEHWFAPMGSNFPSQISEDYQTLFLSTKETVAFDVNIYNGNTVIGTKTISKDHPDTFVIPREYIITEQDGGKMTVLNMGLHLVGTKKFFANLRFSVVNHAEIVTSKGLGGLGENFYLGMPQLQSSRISDKNNHTASVLATENSTTITLSGYNPSIVFTNDSSVTPSKTIVLNKGESYIFEVDYQTGTNSLTNGLIGANITSDKPISVSCGVFSGQVSTSRAFDIFMDQIIPVEKTGREFIVMNGNGQLGISPPSVMEQALIIATDDMTDVYLNNNTSSFPDYTLAKAGDFIFVNASQYFPLSAANNIFGLHIKTSKNVYVYQLLAGSPTNDLASGGMNLIPALSCYLPSKIDELSDVSKNPVVISGAVKDDHDVKLNIIAQAGADVYVNNSKIGLNGPFSVLGSTEWELYSVFDVRGNVTIETKNGRAVTAGIAGGSSNVGFGGYFAGFSSVPAIAKVGDCAKGQELVVDDIYDIYEWYYSPDNTAGSYEPYPKIPDPLHPATYYITPGTQFGYYKCMVTKTSCSPSPLTTKEFKYLKCSELSSMVSPTIGNCQSIPVLTPIFKKDPSIPVDISKTFISQKPAGGNAYVDPLTGKIYFDADNTVLDQVVFKYYFEGSGLFPDSEEVTVTVNIAQINLKNPKISIKSCLQNQMGSYDLKKEFETVNNDPSISRYEYYEDPGYGKRIPDSQLDNYPYYTSKPERPVYVKIYNNFNCYKSGEITLETFELPIINTIDVKNDNSATINVTNGSTPYLYYIKKDGDSYFLPAPSDYSTSNILPIKDGKGTYTVYVKSADDCYPVTQIFTVIGIPNVITPNEDGKNDVIDMSTLIYKLNPTFQIFNRNGVKLFDGNSSNKFIWNGKQNGSPLPTATYWYILKWQDFEGAEPDVMTGWILLKNRN